jgi:cell fate regulator YaaT (PSP1 superfamily)
MWKMYAVFLRIGSLAEIHAAQAAAPLDSGRRVIARTTRGVELGHVVGPCRTHGKAQLVTQVLRPTTQEDELLIRRLDRHKRRAVQSCRAALRDAGSPVTLLDVDQLFDGGTLVMHFLGDVDQQAREITDAVASQYESIVQTRHFAKLISDGCGPDCGTKLGGGCSGSCGSCAVGCSVRASDPN